MLFTPSRNELAKQRPSVGDRIGVAYNGKRNCKNYEAYRVIVERPAAEAKTIDWSKHEWTDDETKQDVASDEDDKSETGPSDGIPVES